MRLRSKRSDRNGKIPKFLLTGGLGLVLLSLFSRARSAEKQLAADRAAREAMYEGGAGEVATSCLWSFTPELLFEKGLADRLWLEIAPLSKLETEVVSNEKEVVIHVTALKTLWVNLYVTVWNRGVTDLVVREAGNWGWSSPLRVSFKFEYLRVRYDKAHDQLVVVLKLGHSIIPFVFAAAGWATQTFTRLLHNYGTEHNFQVDFAPLTNTFTLKKDNVLRSAADSEEARRQKAGLLQLSRSLKYVHLAAPDVLSTLAAMMAGQPNAMKILDYVKARHKVQCGILERAEE